jgi:hypothetical protein
MENRMRSLWNLGAEDDGSGAMPPADMGYQRSPSTPLSPEDIAPEIQARLEAGDPPGKIAMHLEQLEPGLGRALLGHINQAAESMNRVSAPSFAQQNYGGSPERASSASPPSNGMPVHPNLRSELTGDAPQAIYSGAARSLGVNPTRLISAGVSVPNDDKAGVANGFHIDDRAGPSHPAARPHQNRPAYRQVAYKADDKFWGPPPQKPGLFEFIEREGKARTLKANPQIKPNFDRTVKAIVGDSFSPRELDFISREIIDNISIDEGVAFQDGVQIKGGVVYLDEKQWRAVHRLIGTIPRDKLGQRVRSALVEAEKRGRLRRINKNR